MWGKVCSSTAVWNTEARRLLSALVSPYEDKSICFTVMMWEKMPWQLVPNLSEIVWLFIKMQLLSFFSVSVKPGQIPGIRFNNQVGKILKQLDFYRFVIISLMLLCDRQIYHSFYGLHWTACGFHGPWRSSHSHTRKGALTILSFCIPSSTFSSTYDSWQGEVCSINTSPAFHVHIMCFL